MNAKPPLDTVDYEAIEAAVMETPRGRWFLSEYLRRHQAKETERLMAALARLERNLEREAALSPRVRAVLMGTAASLCRHVSNAPPALSVVAEAMATEARAIAEALAVLARAADEAKEPPSDDEGSAEVDTSSTQAEPALSELARRQWELAAQMETLARGMAELAALVDADTPVAGPEPVIPADALRWFAAHDDLFDAAEAAADDTAEQVCRHPANEPDAPATPPEVAARAECEDAVVPGTKLRDGQDNAREGHLTVLIRPRQSRARPESRNTSRPQRSGSSESPDAPASADRRQSRIIIRHKSSSEELAIPFLERAENGKG